MGLSYLRTWKLVDSLNAMFDETAVATQRGGTRGGGAALTTFGRNVVKICRRMEHAATAAATPRLLALQKGLSRQPRPTAPRP